MKKESCNTCEWGRHKDECQNPADAPDGKCDGKSLWKARGPRISEQDLKKHEEFLRSLSDDEIKELLDTYRKVHYPVKPEVVSQYRDGFCGSCGQASEVFYNQKGACVWCSRHKMEKEICLCCENWSKTINLKVLKPIQQLDGDLNIRILANKMSEVVTRMNEVEERARQILSAGK